DDLLDARARRRPPVARPLVHACRVVRRGTGDHGPLALRARPRAREREHVERRLITSIRSRSFADRSIVRERVHSWLSLPSGPVRVARGTARCIAGWMAPDERPCCAPRHLGAVARAYRRTSGAHTVAPPPGGRPST